MKKAFTMIELVFVVVILGILSSVAISKMAVTRDDAQITKGRAQVAAIRNAIVLKRNMNMLQAKGAKWPTRLDALTTNASSDGDPLFGYDSNSSDESARLLDYPLYSKNSNGHWRKVVHNGYVFKVMDTDVPFGYFPDGRFVCNPNFPDDLDKQKYCKALTQ